MSKKGATGPIFKRGQLVEVKGDQIGGGTTWALYWFRGKVLQVNKKKGRVTYNVKMLDPTRFNQKSLTVKDLQQRYVRSGIVAKKHTIDKQRKNQSPRKKGAGQYAEAGSEGSVCESWEDTLAREAAEKDALSGIIRKKRKKKGIPEEDEDDEGKTGDVKFDGKYRKGVDIRTKVAEVKTEEFHLIDRNKLQYGDLMFQTGDKILYREQIYDLRRLRIYKERPVLILENKKDGIRRAEVKDCKIEKSIDDIVAEEEAAQKEANAQKETADKATAEKEAVENKDAGDGDEKINAAEQDGDDVKKGGDEGKVTLSLDLPPSGDADEVTIENEDAGNEEAKEEEKQPPVVQEDSLKVLELGSV